MATRAPTQESLRPDGPTAGAEPAGAEPSGAQPAAVVAPHAAKALSRALFLRLRAEPDGSAGHEQVRTALIEMNLSLVRFVARRFRGRPEEWDDIVQVGTIGLIKAVDRFDVGRNVEFSTFAIPYIGGEIKRFFRDTSWAVHVPRSLQEQRIDLARARDALTGRQGRDPTTAELAAYMQRPVAQVVEVMMASNGYSAECLDAAGGTGHADDHALALTARLGVSDPALENVENVHALKGLLGRLDPQEQTLVRLRFGHGLTQTQIGARLGVSQMQVSRLLNRVLAGLREGILTDAPGDGT
ncbi:SigB/SigF/SigG family RNA polymerase sigma factor [Streptomyces sp. NPDC006733]|uniref:SigB/SigF/SigG family RNA polymerase sigma factor n=1 Tax=Streptomyces sp. NPDC006733 TaxID=3155460 RepID=UPI0033E0C271